MERRYTYERERERGGGVEARKERKREKRDRSRCRLKGLIVLRDRDRGECVSATLGRGSSSIGIADPCTEKDSLHEEVEGRAGTVPV